MTIPSLLLASTTSGRILATTLRSACRSRDRGSDLSSGAPEAHNGKVPLAFDERDDEALRSHLGAALRRTAHRHSKLPRDASFTGKPRCPGETLAVILASLTFQRFRRWRETTARREPRGAPRFLGDACHDTIEVLKTS